MSVMVHPLMRSAGNFLQSAQPGASSRTYIVAAS